MPTTPSPDVLNRTISNFPILVVEDNPDHQLLIDHSLKQCFPQARPTYVLNASEALAHLWSSARHELPTIRLILLDIYLPEPETGWQLLRTIRAKYPYVPIIALSAHHTPEEVQRAYDLGVHSFVSKPMRIEQWATYFDLLRQYWLETVSLPSSIR